MDDALALNRYTAGPWVEIDLAALCENYARLRDATPGAEAAAVVKCNAYGLGLAPIARTLAERMRCRTFFVAYPEEGAALREALKDLAPTAAVYVLNGPLPDTMRLFDEARLTPVVNSLAQAAQWAGSHPNAPCALHIDTGMNRLGAPFCELGDIAALEGLNVSIVMSHLACSSNPADPKNEIQRDAFARAAEMFPTATRSLAASAGTLMDQTYHGQMTRIGIALFGGSPFDVEDERIRPVASLKAPVIQLRDVSSGETVGYGATFAAERPAKIAVAAIGYGDGFPTTGSNKASAAINGERMKVAGRISMDLICLDVTNASSPVEIGDEAAFFGEEISLFEAARACDVIPYELLTGLGGRVDRRYL